MFATERNQVFMVTLRTLYPQEAVLQAAAFEVIDEFLLYVPGQGPALRGHHVPERRVMAFDDLIEKFLFRPVASIQRPGWCDFPARNVRHIALLSMEMAIFSLCSLSV